jgi:hypothetical protein
LSTVCQPLRFWAQVTWQAQHNQQARHIDKITIIKASPLIYEANNYVRK